jgi:multiple sugar transport system substrate-binding protein
MPARNGRNSRNGAAKAPKPKGEAVSGNKLVLRSVLAAASVAAMAVALLPAGLRAQEKVTLTFANWADAESATRPGIQAVIAALEKSHPNIHIESQAIAFSEIAHQLVLRVRSGNPPDIAELQGNDTILLALTGRLEPLDAYLGAGGTGAFTPQALNGLEMRGKLVALPWTVAPVGFWYNKDVMQKAGLDPSKPPATIAELMTDLAAIRKSQPDIAGIGIDTTNRVFSMTANWPWMQMFGANPLADGGRGATTPEFAAYLTWMRTLAQNGYLQAGQKMGDFRPLAAQGKIAFTVDAVLLKGVIQSISHASDEAVSRSWGVAAMPAGPAGKSLTFDSGHDLAIFAASPHKKEAWEFVNYLATSPEAVADYTLKYETSLPPLKNPPGADVAKTLDTPLYNAFRTTVMPTAITIPFGANFAAASTAVMAGVQQAVTSQTPIADIQKSVQENLAKD